MSDYESPEEILTRQLAESSFTNRVLRARLTTMERARQKAKREEDDRIVTRQLEVLMRKKRIFKR